MARAALNAVLEHDPDVSLADAEYWLGDDEYVDRCFTRMGVACQTLLYMVTGLYGRGVLAAMIEAEGDAEPVQ